MFVQPSDLMLEDLQMKGTQGQHQISSSVLKEKNTTENTGKAEVPEPTAADN